MTTATFTRPHIGPPASDEHAPYYSRYTGLVHSDDIVATLNDQLRGFTGFLSRFSEADAEYRYAADKWSVKQVLGHIVDAERIFAYRALRISRNDSTPIEGFEQDGYVASGPFDHCSFSSLVEEFGQVRNATLSLFRCLDEEAWARVGTASNNKVSVRALAYIIAGHAVHHQGILEQKYLPQRSQ
ncbi:MAG TPA: DinB family protein [Terriglobales bacterium]